jgi:hypothetical protein
MDSHRRKLAAAALALAIALPAAAARAQGTSEPGGTVVVPTAPLPALKARPDAVPIDEFTARMIGGGRLKLGILAFDYGITDFLSFGTDPPAWALRAVAHVLVPNLHVKANFLSTPGVIVSGKVGGYYANISTGSVDGNLLVVPATLFVSVKVLPPLWVHLEGAYNWARGFGTGDVSKPDIDGAVVMRTVQVGAMVEYRLSRVVALLARGRYQPYASPIVLEGGGMLDPYTHAEGTLEIRPTAPHPWQGTGAVALTWKYVGVIAGAGYGNYFLPGMNVSDPHVRVIPEASVWATF